MHRGKETEMRLNKKLIVLCALAPVVFSACGDGKSTTLPDGRSPGDVPKDPPPPTDAMLSPSTPPVVLV
jgi:hypothetical protein